ncbi:hypothetical protein PG991_010806 [Apiospora marii]|uniref:Uncharacterized protein n=1 Tax=Apiospora marii TaxID=335849 RepID=A0ABR1RCS1_9PEZI
MPSLPADDNTQANTSQSNANDGGNQETPAPPTSKRPTRGRKRAAPHDEEIEDDGEDAPSKPPANKPASRVNKGKQRAAPRVQEEQEREQDGSEED